MSQTTADQQDLPAFPMPDIERCPFGPPHEYARLRAQAPVTRVACPTGITAWLVSRYAEVREVLGDSQRFVTRPGQAAHVLNYMSPDLPVEEGQFGRMDGAEHLRFRRHLAAEVSTLRHMKRVRPRMRQIVQDQLDHLATLAPPVDLYEEFAKPVTTAVIAELFAIPEADRPLFQRVTAAVFDVTTTKDSLEAALRPLYEYMYMLIATRRAAPGDDALSRMIVQSDQTERPFSDAELLMMAGALLVAGSDTTAVTIVYGFLALMEHRAEFDRLRTDPTLAERAADEVVRYLSIGAGLLREAAVDTELGGQQVSAGDFVIVAVQSANRDEPIGADPDRFDIGRHAPTHLGFGHGPHHCVGRQLARLELSTVLELLPQRIPSLRMAVPLEQVPFKPSHTPVGPSELMVSWDAVLPRSVVPDAGGDAEAGGDAAAGDPGGSEDPAAGQGH